MSEKNVLIFAVIVVAVVGILFTSYSVGILQFEIAFALGVLIGVPGLLGASFYFTYRAHTSLKVMEQERSETTASEIEKTGEKVLGSVKVERPESPLRPGEFVREVLVVTPDKIFIERTADVSPSYSALIIDWTEARRVIPESEVIEVELKKFLRAVRLKIVASGEQYKWFVRGLIPEKKNVRVEEYESILRPVLETDYSLRSRICFFDAF